MDNEKLYDKKYNSGNPDHFASHKKSLKNRVFIDMDGVLCEYRPEVKMADMLRDGYFASLLPRSETKKMEWLDKYISEIDAYHRFFTICGTNKSEAIKDLSSNDVLLDDHSPNLNEWIEAGGKAIKILNEYNGLNGTFMTGPRLKIKSTSTLRHALLDVIRQD